MAMDLPSVGVDVSKVFLDVGLLDGERVRHHRAGNDALSHASIDAWLSERGASPAHICLEATGAYGFDFARAMVAAGHKVSVVNPAQIKAFGKSELLRTKTDKVDAGLIARFCRAMNPSPWAPPAEAVLMLRGMVRRCAALKEMRTQEINRMKAGTTSSAAMASIERSIAFLDSEIVGISEEIAQHLLDDAELSRQNTLLLSIPGIGDRAAAILLGELPDLRDFASAKQLASFVGIAPGESSSGTRQTKSAHITRIGNPIVRSALVLCALSARRYNPNARIFADRLAAKGKPPKVILVAVARKLLTQAHAVLKYGTPFRPDDELQA
jgi:transposase